MFGNMIKKIWQKRKKQRVSDMIGRMFFINPSDEERFSLRLLLLNVKGATSFNDLRTFEDIPYTTFKACAIARGLLQDDKIWDETLTEAALFTTDTRKLRVLFAMILLYLRIPLYFKNTFENFRGL